MSVAERQPAAAPWTVEGSAGREFLDKITRHIIDNGLSEAALRQLARIAGTSHRMLVYYFGSRDGLLGAVLHELRGPESRDIIGNAASRRDALERAWHYYSAPQREIQMRLFFYLAGQTAHDGVGHSEFTDAIVAAWTDELRQVCEREGMRPDAAAAEARLLIASLRGLLLDRLLTGDVAGTDAAFQRLVTTATGRD